MAMFAVLFTWLGTRHRQDQQRIRSDIRRMEMGRKWFEKRGEDVTAIDDAIEKKQQQLDGGK
jgi:hypothetical protein